VQEDEVYEDEELMHKIYIAPSKGMGPIGVYIDWDLEETASIKIMTSKAGEDDEPQRCCI